MADTVECQGCHSRIDPSWVSCPVCMRPRSRREIMRDIIATQQEPLRRRRALWRRLALAVVAAAAGWAAWQQRAGLRRGALKAEAAFSSYMGQYSYRGKASSPAVPADRAAAPVPAAWTVRGLIYDLFSLKPVAGAQVSFTSRLSAEIFRARTDASGRYTLRMPSLREGGYDVAVRHRDYREDYLEENSPPYRTMSLERRREAARLLLQTAVLHVPFLPPEKEVIEKTGPPTPLVTGGVQEPEERLLGAVPEQPQADEFAHDLVLQPR